MPTRQHLTHSLISVFTEEYYIAVKRQYQSNDYEAFSLDNLGEDGATFEDNLLLYLPKSHSRTSDIVHIRNNCLNFIGLES